jgi:subtilase family serine protease
VHFGGCRGTSSPLQPGQIRSASSIYLHTNLPPGTYHLRAKIDNTDRIAESDESNNTFDIPQSLTIVAP